jgi:hypothetical protein
VNTARGFVTDPAPQSALREWRHHLSRPAVLAGQAGVALAAGLSGPFGTYDAFSLPVRLSYWIVVVFATYALGTAVTMALDRRLGAWPPRQQVALQGLVVGGAVVVFLALLNLPLRGWALALDPAAVAGAFAVSWVVMGLRALMDRPSPPGSPSEPSAARLLARLPLEKRGALVALEVQDHYVQVTTLRGRHLLLMRLSDAIVEAEGVAGLQVHRSHWVALEQVRAARRQGDGAVLTLADGREVPVSRARLGAVRAAGLLAR